MSSNKDALKFIFRVQQTTKVESFEGRKADTDSTINLNDIFKSKAAWDVFTGVGLKKKSAARQVKDVDSPFMIRMRDVEITCVGTETVSSNPPKIYSLEVIYILILNVKWLLKVRLKKGSLGKSKYMNSQVEDGVGLDHEADHVELRCVSTDFWLTPWINTCFIWSKQQCDLELLKEPGPSTEEWSNRHGLKGKGGNSKGTRSSQSIGPSQSVDDSTHW